MSSEKKCPYCAEMIKAEAVKCRFCGSDLTAKTPSGSEPQTTAPPAASCTTCKVALIQIEKKNLVSAGGIVGAAIFLAGLLLLFGSPIFGILAMILGVLIGAVGRGKRVQMVCPQCGALGPVV